MRQPFPFPDPDLGPGLRVEGVAFRVPFLLTRPAREGQGVAVGADVQDPGRLGGSVRTGHRRHAPRLGSRRQSRLRSRAMSPIAATTVPRMMIEASM